MSSLNSSRSTTFVLVEKRRSRFNDSKSDRRSDTSSKTASSMTSFHRRFRYRNRLRVSKNCHETIPEVVYQNTYKLKPDEADRFCTKDIEQIIYSVLESSLKDKEYDAKRCPALGTKMAEQIKERVKASGLSRYKLVAYVTIVQNQGEGCQQVSRCLWDPEVDNFATATYECKSFYAVGSLYAMYFE